MSWDFSDQCMVKKTKKNHECAFCGRTIPEGSKDILHWWGKWDGEFQNSYACDWCESHQQELTEDNEIIEFWDCLREDIFEEQFKKFRECDCVSGNIDADFEADYLVWKCEDCKREWHREYMPISS